MSIEIHGKFLLGRLFLSTNKFGHVSVLMQKMWEHFQPAGTISLCALKHSKLYAVTVENLGETHWRPLNFVWIKLFHPFFSFFVLFPCQVHKSLLYSLTEADEAELNRFQACGLLSKEPFNSWIGATCNKNQNQIRFLVAYWMIFLVMYFIHVLLYTKNGFPYRYIMVFCFIAAGFILLMEAFHIKNNLRELYISIK